jgi:hypothetical protein
MKAMGYLALPFVNDQLGYAGDWVPVVGYAASCSNGSEQGLSLRNLVTDFERCNVIATYRLDEPIRLQHFVRQAKPLV